MSDSDPVLARQRVDQLDPVEVLARSLRLMERPPLFDLELVSACNVVCVFCPRQEMQRSARVMSEGTFAQVLRLLPAGADAMLSGLGDSTMHPRLGRFVADLRAIGVRPTLITNGVLLTAELQDRLIDAGIHEVQISVHGDTPDGVRSVVPKGAQPQRVRAQVERLAATSRVLVRINYVETESNVNERPAVEAWASSIGARFFYRRLHNRGGAIGEGRSARGCEACGIFPSVTFVSADGLVFPCVNDVQGEGALGHVGSLTWESIQEWKRQTMRTGAWFPPCRTCDDDYRWVILDQGGIGSG